VALSAVASTGWKKDAETDKKSLAVWGGGSGCNKSGEVCGAVVCRAFSAEPRARGLDKILREQKKREGRPRLKEAKGGPTGG